MPLTAGTRLGPYEVVALVGAGGMGEVYRARDGKLGREVAVKVLPPGLAGNPERLARFEREAKVLAALNHPNIAIIHRSGRPGHRDGVGGRAHLGGPSQLRSAPARGNAENCRPDRRGAGSRA